ncbi:50S ribosomal protein L11 methyltransferase [Geobacter sp. DSM 9736]|uniref:50S ribosomal protein L11 methyltransferase n=1 Tax=Geobacter sp. DSM 9736 TaxID=1277350 RepID=UPI000B508342|nr:50S ribosomal protein L11 methyltransferase [Geobacter sp. DSM 9736]SNB47576.1 [LSU ribosomal protein L11P]-lysine N-methyltransferase [Geobacter sp. DSM 9736]
MKSGWIEVSCTVPDEMVDVLAEYLIELSGCGVSIENICVDTFTTDSIASSPEKNICAYFSADASLEGVVNDISAFLMQQTRIFPGYTYRPPSIQALGDEDWANNWKAFFKPSRIGCNLVIKPTWEEYSASPGDIVLELDPGQAFGTGTHPTTRLCLEALEKIMSPSPRSLAVLDVGTGSGVLTIAAAKMGAWLVHALDIDPEAIRVASENLLLNSVTSEIRLGTEPLDEIPGEFDVVLANIIAEELVKLAPELVEKLALNGFLILSGILKERESFVRQGFDLPELDFQSRTEQAEWCCLTYRRKS